MNATRIERSDTQLDLLWELVSENIVIAGDITEVGVDTWAIHGIIPVDGEVIIAEFETYEQARTTLHRIAAKQAR